ncbi:MAG: ABC transporter ATP-binding protein [Aerococcus sp.]|nr:ABC transporter ATP-binding protein [Aerococcus sp.]
MEVQFKNVSMQYAKGERMILDDINFKIDDHQLVSILGPSGSGKSTTLMLISGLIFPTGGQIFFDDEEVTNWDAVKRKVGMVFQNYALYPHLNVRDNISFPLKMAGMKKEEHYKRAEELADLVQVSEHLDKQPSQLSGGQQQRVAIARALAKKPSVLLMDEPLSNLDAKLRVEMREEIRRIQQKTGITTVFVTHDQTEALSISDKVLVLDSGKIQQASHPQHLYEDPENLFVAQFLGTPEINIFALDSLKDTLPNDLYQQMVDQAVTQVGIRPEVWERTDMNTALVSGLVKQIEIVGKERNVEVERQDGQRVRLADLPVDFQVGDTLHLGVDTAQFLCFDQAGRRVKLV